MKCGPDDCPIRAFSDLTPAEQRVERKRTAKKMEEQGFTHEQIAKQLNVSRETITKDLAGLVIVTKPRRQKGGRPKGSGKRSERHPKAVEREEKVAALHDAGLSAAEIGQKIGLGERAVHQALEHVEIKREAEAIIDPATLSVSAQEKLAAAMRQYQRKLDAKYEKDLRDGIQKAVEDTVLPHYEEKIALSEQITKARAGFMKKSDYNKIRFCLHPDQYMNRTPEQRNAAAQLWEELEVVLVNEAERPTDTFNMPKTYAELLARKQAAQEKRKTKRSTGRQSLACG